jgi:hypothetical protein
MKSINSHHRASPLCVVPRPGEANSSPSPQDLYPETRSQWAWRVVCLGCAAFWLVAIVWWAA